MIRAWVADHAGARAVSPAEGVRLAREGAANVWLDLDADDEAGSCAALEPLGIHPLALEDMVMQINRPKVDDYGPYLYLAVHSARWEDDRPTLREIDILLGERFIATYCDGSSRSIAAAHQVLPRRPELLARGPSHLLHFMLDLMVDHYLPIMDRLTVETDELEEQVFAGDRPAVHERILRLRRAAAALRRIVGPQRDTLLALTRDEFRAVPAEMRPYLRDVYDRLARVGDLLESFRDEVTTLLELQVAIVSNRLNQVIKVLTVVATVMLPLTVVTSYYGMNFKFVEYEWRYATPYILALLAATAAGTWWFLKARRWL